MTIPAWSAGALSPQMRQWTESKLALTPDERVLQLATQEGEGPGFQAYRIGGSEEALSALYTDPGRKAYDKVVAVNNDPLELEQSGELKVLRLLLRAEGKVFLFLTPRPREEAAEAADRLAAMLWDAGLHVDEYGHALVDDAWATWVVGRRIVKAGLP